MHETESGEANMSARRDRGRLDPAENRVFSLRGTLAEST
jgi:hypothetical protein